MNNLPKNNLELDKVFLAGSEPTPEEFRDGYRVEMLTGPIPNLRRFSHRKIFFSRGGNITGYNVLFKNLVWGHFSLQKIICRDMGSVRAVEINYDRSENFFSRPIRDRVRRIGEGVYLGRFYYVLFGKPRFLAYFTLTKTENAK